MLFLEGQSHYLWNDVLAMTEVQMTDSAAPLASVGPAPTESVRDERRSARRFPYPHVQQIAFYAGGRIPGKDAYCPVRCHEISQEGISFFYPTAPEQERLIIALGSQALETLVLAEVRYHVPAQAVALFDPTNAVNERFLVECTFLRRLGS